jgi:hypothetical protein
MKIGRGLSDNIARWPMRARVWRRFLAAVVVPGSIVLAGTAGVATAVSASGTTVHYGIITDVCREAASPADAACFAMRRVDVNKGTPGAVAFKLGGDAYATGPLARPCHVPLRAGTSPTPTTQPGRCSSTPSNPRARDARVAPENDRLLHPKAVAAAVEVAGDLPAVWRTAVDNKV